MRQKNMKQHVLNTGYGLFLLILACQYEKGRGVERDYTRAMFWYEKAADNGEILAMDRLGQIYSGGLCFQARDQEEARRWRERSFRIRRGWVSSPEKP